MDEIFTRAKSILVVWTADVNPESLPAFQDVMHSKAPHATIAFENIEMIVECKLT